MILFPKIFFEYFLRFLELTADLQNKIQHEERWMAFLLILLLTDLIMAKVKLRH